MECFCKLFSLIFRITRIEQRAVTVNLIVQETRSRAKSGLPKHSHDVRTMISGAARDTSSPLHPVANPTVRPSSGGP